MFANIEGKRFGRLIAQWPVGTKAIGKTERSIVWLCNCDCGKLHTVAAMYLKSGGSRSCGCLRLESVKRNLPKATHRLCGTPEYQTWLDMRSRCNNVQYKYYRHYGGRGITVCSRWDSFENFLADIGPRPEGVVKTRAYYTLDRIDNNGNYEPGNCRWATPKEQMNNRRPETKPRRRCVFSG